MKRIISNLIASRVIDCPLSTEDPEAISDWIAESPVISLWLSAIQSEFLTLQGMRLHAQKKGAELTVVLSRAAQLN